MISKFIEETSKHFEQIKRGDETVTSFKVSRPDKLRDSVYKAHGDRMPNDWIFDTYDSILSNLSGYTLESVEDIENARPEIVDGLVNVYTYELEQWIADSNSHYIQEAIDEYGAPKDGGTNILMLAQYMAIDGIFSHVAEYITANHG